MPGLRREEVASLAGVSVEYYKRLERGNLSGVSDLVLETLELSADTGLVVNVYTAEPGSETEQALNLLGTWAATLAEERDAPRRTSDHWTPRSSAT